MNKYKLHIIIFSSLLVVLSSCIREHVLFSNDNRGNFEALWQIIDERYCYLDSEEKAIDWNLVYTNYSARIDTVSSKYGLFSLFSEMLAELKDGHVNLYSAFDRSRYWDWYTNYPSNFSSSLVNNERYLGYNYRIAGPFRYTIIPNTQIGYIHYSSFASAFSETNIRAMFEIFKSCEGLIIDVRNNGGGNLSYSDLLASFFFNESTITSYIRHKTGKGHSDFSEPKAIYTHSHQRIEWKRPVAILTNRMSYSATNEFVCRMKSAPHAIIIGDKTGGGGGLPLSSELPNGWMVRFSASPMFDAQMNDIEMGIDPSINVNITIEDELRGVDTIIETAIQAIQNWNK